MKDTETKHQALGGHAASSTEAIVDKPSQARPSQAKPKSSAKYEEASEGGPSGKAPPK